MSSFIKKSFRPHPYHKQTSFLKKIENILLSSWWVIVFILVCYIAYATALDRREEEKIILQKKVDELFAEKAKALEQNEELHLQINSQKDPAWIELTLMKGLGLVPEGQTKVFFLLEKK